MYQRGILTSQHNRAEDSIHVKQRNNIIFLAISVLCVLWITLICRTPDASRSVFTDPFWTFAGQKHWQKFLLNGMLFVPLGYFSFVEFKRMRSKWLCVLMLIITFSALIETAQFITNLGTWDIDDIISNTLGGNFGLVFAFIIDKLKEDAGNASFNVLLRRGVSLILITAELIACFAFRPSPVP